MTHFSAEQDAIIEEARRIPVYEAFKMLSAQPALVKVPNGFNGPCPVCNDGDDRFDINVKENYWACRVCHSGGDGIELLLKADGETFIGAVQRLSGLDWPGGKVEVGATVADPDALRERVEERRAEAARVTQEALQKDRKTKGRVQEFFDGLQPFKGSLAETYLRNRRVVFLTSQTTDFRFAEKIDYRGYAERDAKEETVLGEFPALVAAIKNFSGEIIGVHRTYIDPATGMKLRPPGDTRRNKAKKVWGKQNSGHIALGPYMETMAAGEGIETTGRWYQLGIGPDDVGIMCGINLGNLTGQAVGRMAHPTNPKAMISNLEPKPASENSIMVLPPIVKNLILLIDGGGDEMATRAQITTAGRHYRSLGVNVMTCHPGIDGDFADLED